MVTYLRSISCEVFLESGKVYTASVLCLGGNASTSGYPSFDGFHDFHFAVYSARPVQVPIQYSKIMNIRVLSPIPDVILNSAFTLHILYLFSTLLYIILSSIAASLVPSHNLSLKTNPSLKVCVARKIHIWTGCAHGDKSARSCRSSDRPTASPGRVSSMVTGESQLPID